MQSIIGIFRYIATFFTAILIFVACDDGADGAMTSAHLSMNDLSGTATNCAVVLTAQQGMNYTARIVSGEEWCQFANDKNSVEGTITPEESPKAVFLYLSVNYTGITRHAEVYVEFANGDRYVMLLTQHSADPTIALYKEWPELPVCNKRDNVDYRFYQVDNMGSRSNVRNYTICFDRTKKASLWVAYPLHSCYTNGSASRNDEFVPEPTIPLQYQPTLYRSYRGWYDRGHQIAAADRKCSQEMMDQTFYWTNMTPQQSNFNQKLWASLEGKVRNKICSDTLYVVTGAYFDGERDSSVYATTTDGNGGTCPIPTHYYKLMLRTVKGNTGKAISEITDAGELRAIAVYIQHHNSGDDNTLQDEYFISVNELERITGFDFFPMLDDAIEEQVESQTGRTGWF